MDIKLIIQDSTAIQEEFKKIGVIPAPPCRCECCEPINSMDHRMANFVCAGCKREMFCCYGQDDRFFDYCDNCWHILDKAFPETED